MEKTLLSDIAAYCSGTLRGQDVYIEGVTTDTRNMHPGDLFVPLIGERFDAHDFLPRAAEVCAAVLSGRDCDPGVPVVRVADTGDALLAIAGAYRRRFRIPLAAVTGSTGKTTTKQILASILSRRFETVFTQGNYNNHVGVPLTLLRLAPSTGAAVVEMGMNHFGEISRLTAAAAPTAAVITNIGSMHLEFLGSREGILKAKCEIFEGLSPDGTAVLNADDDMLRTLEGRLPFRTVWYGIDSPAAQFRAADVEERQDSTSFTLKTPRGDRRVTLPMAGIHNVMDALAASAAAMVCGAGPDDVRAGLESAVNTGGRQRTFAHGEYTVIDDCYNAGPDSVRAALSVLSKAPGRRVAVLGSMLELGSVSGREHVLAAQEARQAADLVFLFGEEMEPAALPGEHYATREELAEALRAAVRPGDTILFKGSRGMHMEKVMSMFMEGRS